MLPGATGLALQREEEKAVVPMNPLIRTTVVPISGVIVMPISGVIGKTVMRRASATGSGYRHDGSMTFSYKLKYALNYYSVLKLINYLFSY